MHKKIKKIYNYLSASKLFFLVFTVSYFRKNFDIQPTQIYTDAQLIKQLREGKSFVRFGDGETALLLGESIHFQKYSKKLSLELKKIVESYSEDSQYIIGIAKRYLFISNKELKKKKLFFCWLPSKVYFNLFFNKKLTYADAHIFYTNSFFSNYLSEYLQDKSIIIVTNEKTILGLKSVKNEFLSQTTFIETKSENSYDEIDKISEMLINNSQGNTIVLLSLGPAGKALAYRLLGKGVQCIDVGHGLETFFTENSLEHVLV